MSTKAQTPVYALTFVRENIVPFYRHTIQAYTANVHSIINLGCKTTIHTKISKKQNKYTSQNRYQCLIQPLPKSESWRYNIDPASKVIRSYLLPQSIYTEINVNVWLQFLLLKKLIISIICDIRIRKLHTGPLYVETKR